jgi:hypothetical protein
MHVALARTDAPLDASKRLDASLSALVDVQTIMQTMPNAIRSAVSRSSS